jgi:hypothetical protein
VTAPAADAHPVDRAAVAATSRSADVPRVPRRRTADPPQPRQDRRRRGLSGSPETPTGSTCPYRALPGPMINLIRDGVSRSKLRAGGDRAVFNALVSTATSAQQRGHTYAEWAALISQVNSALGLGNRGAAPGHPARRDAAKAPEEHRPATTTVTAAAAVSHLLGGPVPPGA